MKKFIKKIKVSPNMRPALKACGRNFLVIAQKGYFYYFFYLNAKHTQKRVGAYCNGPKFKCKPEVLQCDFPLKYRTITLKQPWPIS